MKSAGQTALMLTGFAWALSALVLGLTLMLPALRGEGDFVMGLAFAAVGLFLAMWLVIDPLVPQAGPFFTGTLKLLAVVLFFASGFATLYGIGFAALV